MIKRFSDSIIEKIKALICSAIPEIQIIYLFGSVVSGDMQPDSDVDIAFLSALPVSSKMRWELSEKIAAVIKRDVDLVDLSPASTVMRFQIISTGKRIYFNDSYYCNVFEDYAYSSYLRFNEERKAILQDIYQRGRIGQ